MVARGRNDDKSALQESVNHGNQDSTSRSACTQLTMNIILTNGRAHVETPLTWNPASISDSYPISALDQSTASRGVSRLLPLGLEHDFTLSNWFTWYPQTFHNTRDPRQSSLAWWSHISRTCRPVLTRVPTNLEWRKTPPPKSCCWDHSGNSIWKE